MYIVKLPSGEYLNLALIQRVEIDKDPILAVIHWSKNNRSVYNDKKDVEAIIEAMTNQYLDFSNDETT
ncbi:hypothetical protein [Synechocystis sp. PCC 7509]|uniref:hypothetical protein n=1 Tax=Synechocystis sp. PCC 7509 TaxID=927677 RepID=UPI0002AC08CC|nr:hypothetical protein [Synechocystis sp. PCC 7509]